MILCPAKGYMSNGHSTNMCMHSINSDWLKIDFWIHGPVTANTSHSGRPVNNSLSLYDVSAATDHVSKNQLSNNQNLLNACANSWNDCWICIIPLDMYRLAQCMS